MENEETEEKFIPRGAIAFFAVVIFMSLVTWFAIYLLMLARH